jgi:16S rRNA (cytidine1402-2'-O)-methyltransferase
VAVDLTLESERVATRAASEWKKQAGAFEMHKRPAIFLMLAN